MPEQGCHLRILIGIVQICQEITAQQRNDDTDQGDDEGGESCLFQLLNVGFQTGAEHEDDDAQLSQTDDQIVALYHIQQHRPQNDTGSQCAYNLRQADAFGQQTEEFGGKQNDCDLQ